MARPKPGRRHLIVLFHTMPGRVEQADRMGRRAMPIRISTAVKQHGALMVAGVLPQGLMISQSHSVSGVGIEIGLGRNRKGQAKTNKG